MCENLSLNDSNNDHFVIASFPDGTTDIFVRTDLFLPIGKFISPKFFSNVPHTIAWYVFFICRFANIFANARYVASVFAKIIAPLVSLSRRWTTPGRESPPNALKLQCAKIPYTNVADAVPFPR
jgi:hypothetical protein